MPELAPAALPSAHQVAECSLQVLLTSTRPAHRGVLIVGPSGSGKTTLVRDSCATAGVPLVELSVTSLLDDSPGCESVLADSFALCSPRRVLFIDHLNAAAPRGRRGLRVAAALNDALAAAYEECFISSESIDGNDSCNIQNSLPPILIAAAPDKDSVHASLVRAGRFSLVLPLTALALSDRVAWAHRLLQALFPSPEDRSGNDTEKNDKGSETNHPAHAIARLTPGFLPSDMIRLLRRFDASMLTSSSPPKSAKQFVSSGLATSEAAQLTPSLLAFHTDFHMPSMHPHATTIPEDELPGLESSISTLRRAFAAALDPSTPAPLRGALLTGPSGSGKTTLLRLLSCLVPPRAANILPIGAASIVSSRVGEAERALASIFSIARTIAPAVVVLDDVELLAPRRAGDLADEDGDGANGASELFARVLSTLLVEIDGVKQDTAAQLSAGTPPVLVVAATRDPSLVDRALLRPGRLDLHVQLELPDANARMRILHRFFNSRNLRIEEFFGEGEVASEAFATLSQGWTAAEVIAHANDIVREESLRHD